MIISKLCIQQQYDIKLNPVEIETILLWKRSHTKGFGFGSIISFIYFWAFVFSSINHANSVHTFLFSIHNTNGLFHGMCNTIRMNFFQFFLLTYFTSSLPKRRFLSHTPNNLVTLFYCPVNTSFNPI